MLKQTASVRGFDLTFRAKGTKGKRLLEFVGTIGYRALVEAVPRLPRRVAVCQDRCLPDCTSVWQPEPSRKKPLGCAIESACPESVAERVGAGHGRTGGRLRGSRTRADCWCKVPPYRVIKTARIPSTAFDLMAKIDNGRAHNARREVQTRCYLAEGL